MIFVSQAMLVWAEHLVFGKKIPQLFLIIVFIYLKTCDVRLIDLYLDG